jgi:hypothetical protein
MTLAILQPEIMRADGAILAKYIGGVIDRAANGTWKGHGIRWHKERPDLHGEHFSPKTYLMRNAGYPVIGIPTNYQHGLHKDFGNLAIGLVRFADEDEIGLFVEGEQYTREQYIEMLKEIGRKTDFKFSDTQLGRKSELMVKAVDTLVSTVPMQFSGGFDPSTWVVDAETKHIDQAGMIHLAFTPTPADDLNPIVQFKSALQEVLKYEPTTIYSLPNQLSDPQARIGYKGSEGSTGTVNEAAQPNGAQQPIDNPMNKELIKMDVELINALIEQLTALAQQLGATPEEAVQMAGDVAKEVEEEEIKAEGDEEEKPEEIMEKAFARLIQKHEAKKSKHAAMASKGSNLLHNYQKQQPATQSLPAFSGNGKPRIDNRAGMGGIVEHSPFKHWSAEDFSFALALKHLSQGKGKRVDFDATPAFYQEFADKAIKGYNENKLTLQPGAFKSIQAIKANEVQHSTLADYGDEWVPTIWADTIWEKPRLDNVIQNIFKSIEMPSNPYEYPVESTDPSVYLVAETTAEAVLALDISTSPIPDSRVGTDKVTFSAKKFGLRVMWSGELQEDAIARLVPQFRAQAERAIQNTIDNAAINGDTSTTTNINSDGETITDTTRPYLAYDGLIHQPLVTATTNRLDAGGAAPTLAMLRTIRSYLGAAEGRVPSELALIVDFPTYMKLLSDDNVVTVDKYGSAATVLTGELGRIDGVPVFVSDQMALADADGKVTQTSNTVNRGRAILVHRATWMMGFRRRIQQSLDYLPWYDTWVLTMTLRNDFKPRTASDGTLSSSDNSTAILYNIGV